MAKLVSTTRSDVTIVLVLACLACGYGLLSITVRNMRAERLGPMCAKYGWELIDFNLGGPAKCRDPKTNLMYLPTEVLNAR